MDKFKIITSSGIEKEVDGIFYLYNSKYFVIYTEKETDENEYVVFHLVQVGKEIKNTPEGPVDTGYMVGMDISDPQEWKNVQNSVTRIVEDKKNDIQSGEIQYLPQDMLNTLKIMSTKTFRLAKSVVEQTFKLNVLNETLINSNEVQASEEDKVSLITPEESQINSETLNSNVLTSQSAPLEISSPESVNVNLEQNNLEELNNTVASDVNLVNNGNNMFQAPVQDSLASVEQNDVIIDYRASFFEEQEKNKELEEKIKILNEKLENIKSLIG